MGQTLEDLGNNGPGPKKNRLQDLEIKYL